MTAGSDRRVSGIFMKTTEGIRVTAMPHYLADQSAPEDDQYVWAYTIRIENTGSKTVKLIDRRWRITDASGQLQTVEGAGVVGEQPVIEPGSTFQYTSGTVLSTPLGVMEGSYCMERTESRERLAVAIPAFSLDSPSSLARPN